MEEEKAVIVSFCGSPRRNGNTDVLLERVVSGAKDAGARVDEIWLRDVKMSPCLEIYGCQKTGRCAINDDFQAIYDKIIAARGIIVASPIFFYSVSAHTKIFMDRCQSFWVKKNWLAVPSEGKGMPPKKGLFVSVGATKGKKLFDGALLSIRYFFEAIDTKQWGNLLYRGLDFKGDVLKHPEYLLKAYHTGKTFGREVLASDRAA